MIKSVNNQDFKIIAVSNRKLCNRPFLEQIERVCKIHPEAVILREKDLTEEEYDNWKIGKISTSKLYTQLSKSLKYTEVLDFVIDAIYDMEETIRKYNISYADINIKNILDSELRSYRGQAKDNIYSGVGKILKEKYSFTEKQKWELIQIRMELQKLRENIKNRK